MNEDLWKPASEPPHAYLHPDWYQKESDPVLGWIGGRMAVVIYIEDDERAPLWRTLDSEWWDVTNLITHWTDTPKPPTKR